MRYICALLPRSVGLGRAHFDKKGKRRRLERGPKGCSVFASASARENISVSAPTSPFLFLSKQLASKKHRESASYLYDAHGSGSSKGTMRERNSRYTSRHKVCWVRLVSVRFATLFRAVHLVRMQRSVYYECTRLWACRTVDRSNVLDADRSWIEESA